MAVNDLSETLRTLIENLEDSAELEAGVPAAEAGRLIAGLRRKRGLRQWELARLAETRQSFVSKVERGKEVRLETILRLADALGFDLVLLPKERDAGEPGCV